eukprot:GHVU01112000.1.p1 GENE.GHVU01112000.1~~GHVU01112000.1.p1  ORF type:complete len:204 (+),score=36.13 GHVU01112000.1:217-828(+)
MAAWFSLLILSSAVLLTQQKTLIWRQEEWREEDVVEWTRDEPRGNVQGQPRDEPSNDVGQAKNCGDQQHAFTLTWEPAALKQGNDYKVHFKANSAVAISTAKVDIKVYTEDFSVQLFQFNKQVQCSHFVPSCPVKKGAPLDISKSYKMKDRLPIQTGKYGVKIKVTNDKDELFVCAQAVIDNQGGPQDLTGFFSQLSAEIFNV